MCHFTNIYIVVSILFFYLLLIHLLAYLFIMEGWFDSAMKKLAGAKAGMDAIMPHAIGRRLGVWEIPSYQRNALKSLASSAAGMYFIDQLFGQESGSVRRALKYSVAATAGQWIVDKLPEAMSWHRPLLQTQRVIQGQF